MSGKYNGQDRKMQLPIVISAIVCLLLVAAAMAVGWRLGVDHCRGTFEASIKEVTGGLRQDLDGLARGVDHCRGTFEASIKEVTGGLRQDLDGLARAVDVQISMLSKATGEPVPTTRLDSVTPDLERIGKALKDPAKWPLADRDILDLRKQLLELANRLSWWGQMEVAPELDSLRWHMEAATACRDANMLYSESVAEADTQQIDECLTGVEYLLTTAPEDVSSHVLGLLDNHQAKLREVRLRIEQTEVLAQAREALYNRGDAALALARVDQILGGSDAPPADERELQEVQGVIKPRMETPSSPDGEGGLREVQEELRRAVVNRHYSQTLDLLSQKLSRTCELPDVSSRAATVASLHAQVCQLRVDMAVDGAGSAPLDQWADLAGKTAGRLQELHRSSAAETAQRRRSYQAWALKHISVFEQDFDRERNEADGRSRMGETWHTHNYEHVYESMLTHLMPIDVRLLELPVLDRFSKAWQMGWTKLEDHEGGRLQVELASKSAEVEKHNEWSAD